MISCIVPVHHEKLLLSRCLDSLLASEYKDFELLVVLNGKDDGSGDIALTYAQKDTRIKVLKNEKTGVSAARNRGLRNANGDYVCFCDADDTVQPQWMGTLLDALIGTDAALSGCSYRDVTHGNQQGSSLIKNYYFKREGILTRKDYLLEINGPYANNWGLLPPVVMKLFRADIIKEWNISFDESLAYAEDFDFTLQYLKHCASVSIVNKPLYDYHKNTASAMSRYHANILDAYQKNIYDILGMMDSSFSSDERVLIFHMLSSMTIGGMVRLCRRDADIPDDEIKRRLADFTKQPFLSELYTCYRPGPGQSAEIPLLALSGDTDALFTACRIRSGDNFAIRHNK